MAVAPSLYAPKMSTEGAELETAFPQYVIIHPEQLGYVLPAAEKGKCVSALGESRHMSGRLRGREHERATIPRLRRARYNTAATQCV
jgi:hypothetical protein